MRQVYLNSITGNVPESQSKYCAGRFMVVNASVVLDGGRGPRAASKVEKYFAKEGGPGPLRIAVTDNIAEQGVQAHIDANKVRIDTLLADAELPAPDRREMAEFLCGMNHQLNRALAGHGELPVIFN